MRLVLHRLFGERPLEVPSWATSTPGERPSEYHWQRRDVSLLDVDADQLLSEIVDMPPTAIAP